jgi:cobalt-zinc-cadmium efflux system protein
MADHVHSHAHDHDHAHGHFHAPPHGNSRALVIALLLTLGFCLIEAGAGWWAGSLALLGDAGHMFTDASALGLAALAARIALRPSSHRHTWGMGRAEVVAALLNALFMLAIVTGIVIGAVQRLREPVAVNAITVILVAAAGLAVNLIVLRTLSHGHGDLNTRGAILHVMGDLLGSVAAIAAGAVIYFTGWMPIDPILSVVICMLILISSLRLLREGLHVLMEGVPSHLSLQEIGESMARTPGVWSVHDLHIWQVSTGQVTLSAHVVLKQIGDWQSVLGRLQSSLAENYGIQHVTLQPELMQEVRVPLPKSSRAHPGQL